MLSKFNSIVIYALIAMLGAMFLYPSYIRLLKYLKAGKQIRKHDGTGQESVIFSDLHQHKAGTPTMG